MRVKIPSGFAVVTLATIACSSTTTTRGVEQTSGGAMQVGGIAGMSGTRNSGGTGTSSMIAGGAGSSGTNVGGAGNAGGSFGGASSGGISGGIGGATGTATAGAAGNSGAGAGGTVTGGAPASTGGMGSGGITSGGINSGGTAGGGTAGSGTPTSTGGAALGGSPTGGTNTGGAATGGAGTGGMGTGGTGTGGVPATWCAQQIRPVGVAVEDYQCVDFDSGLPPSSTWPQTLANSGTLTLSNSRASSIPSSLVAMVPAAATYATVATAAMSWGDVGSTPVTGISVTASLSPVAIGGVVAPWTGNVALLCAAFGAGRACLNYTLGATTDFQAAYTGYYIEAIYTGGPALRSECVVTGTLTANVWTRVELRVAASTGVVQILFGGTTVGTCTGTFGADTVAVSTVGLRVTAATTVSWSLYYDNVVVAVTR